MGNNLSSQTTTKRNVPKQKNVKASKRPRRFALLSRKKPTPAPTPKKLRFGNMFQKRAPVTELPLKNKILYKIISKKTINKPSKPVKTEGFKNDKRHKSKATKPKRKSIFQ